ncbi:HK97 gp10 family phage protein [Zooshikella ganghwensis]|uniref:HK97 gp10 family phage protein n=2 Tax=Zooshikella ganghwensis TaxID=202772 RepID=A0A4P9VEV7_9GAMM|nr:HK97 gp10 family phage protein [Zooshikella ganghwensis]RDH41598.1 HK97 gp10 family phage protein [Zooshikella ganghwensis]
MQVNVELTGIEELAEQLRYIEQNIVNKALNKALVEQVKPLKQGMKQRAPKFTGELRQKISHKGIVKKILQLLMPELHVKKSVHLFCNAL